MSDNNKPESEKVELGITLEHDDGVVRAQSWLKGTVTIRQPPRSLSIVVSANEFQEYLQSLSSCELHVDVVGHEVSHVPVGGVMGSFWSKATHCSSMIEKELIVFEKHKCIHDSTRIPHQVNTDNNSAAENGICLSYPFSIYLPGHLPPSMELDDTEGGEGSCGIHYQLRARLGGTATTTVQEHALTVVGAALSSKKYRYTLPPKLYPVVKGAGGGVPGRDGYLILAARVENTHVAKGQDLHFSLSCRNRSRHCVHSVDVRVIETVRWNTTTPTTATTRSSKTHDTAEHHQSHRNQKMFTLASYSNLVLDALQNEIQDTPTASSSPTTAHNNHEQCSRTKVDPLTQADMHNDLWNESNTVCIRLPTWARNTYAGTLVTVSHRLQICWAVHNHRANDNNDDDPHVEIPIRVYDPPIIETTHRAPAPMVVSRKIEQLAMTQWVDQPDAMPRQHCAFESC